MSKIEVNKVGPQCGTTVTVGCGAGQTVNVDAATVTLGRCGGSVALASGATQTGFGRTGTVDWQTTIKTGDFTAVSGEGYFVNTTSGAITVTLPASPSAGNIVAVADYAGTAATNNITIARNGSNFEGGTVDGGIATIRQTGTFVYADATQGWVAVNSNDASFLLPSYVTATGGTISFVGDYKIHTFTGPGTFCVSCAGNSSGSNTVDYLVIAGGGSGGGRYGGGGGGGGYRESPGTASGSYSVSPLGAPPAVALSVPATSYPITVGAGGAQSANDPNPGGSNQPGNKGNNSVFSTITSTAGGAGASQGYEGPGPAYDGGSGGGSAHTGPAGTGNTPPTNPAQGTSGGTGIASPYYMAGGGGGATVAGSNAPPSGGGAGGAGATSSINGSSTARSGGGGAGGSTYNSPGAGGAGGTGGGGPGGSSAGSRATAGTANTGGGGGGGFGAPGMGGAGGSGIVIIRYRFQT